MIFSEIRVFPNVFLFFWTFLNFFSSSLSHFFFSSTRVSFVPYAISRFHLVTVRCFMGNIFVYYHSSTPMTRPFHTESPKFDVLSRNFSKDIWCCYLVHFPKVSVILTFFDYLTLQFIIFSVFLMLKMTYWVVKYSLHSCFTDLQGKNGQIFFSCDPMQINYCAVS